MPSASSFINKVRTGSEGRNTKVEYRGGIAQTNALGALGCSDVNWWVDTKYQEISKTCNNIVIVIKNVLPTIDNIRGLFTVSWDLKTLCDVNVLYLSYIRLYRSDGLLLETIETDRFTTNSTFSTVLISGYSYYATIASINSNIVQTNTIQFIYGNPIYISVLPTDIIPYVVRHPYITLSSNTITTWFFSTFPTLIKIDYYFSNVNTIGNGTLVSTFTADTSLITSHSYTDTTLGYYYVVITPTNKTSFTSSNNVAITSLPVATSLIYSETTLTLNYSINKNSPVTISYYSSVTPTGSQTLIGTKNLNVISGTNTDTLTIVSNTNLFYHATVYGVGNSSSIDAPNLVTTSLINNQTILTLNYNIYKNSPVTINYYSSITPTTTQTLIATHNLNAVSTSTNTDTITTTANSGLYYHATVNGANISSSIDTNYDILYFSKTSDTIATLQYYLTTSSSVTIKYYSRTINSGSYVLETTKTINASTGFNVDSITVTSTKEYYATITIGSQILTSSVATSARSVIPDSRSIIKHVNGPLIMPNGNIYLAVSANYGFGNAGNVFVYTPTNTSPTFVGSNSSTNFNYYFNNTSILNSSICVGSDNLLYGFTTVNVVYAFNSDGTSKWSSTPISTPSVYSIAVGSSYLYAITSNGIQYINKTSGGTFTRTNTTITNGSYITVGSDGNVYVQTLTTIYAFTPLLVLLWSYAVTSTKGRFAVSSSGNVYCNNSGNNTIVAIKPPTSGTTGVVSWSFNLGKTSTNNIFIGSDGTIYASTGDTSYASNNLYAISSNGTQKWSYNQADCTIQSVGIYNTGGVDIIYALITTSTSIPTPVAYYAVVGNNTTGFTGGTPTPGTGTAPTTSGQIVYVTSTSVSPVYPPAVWRFVTTNTYEYLGSTSNTLYGFSSANGSIVSTMIGDYNTAAIGTDGKIFACTPSIDSKYNTCYYSLIQLK